MSSAETFDRLQAVLEPLGIDLGREVLHVWRDRQNAGQEPLPEPALRDLAEWVEKQLAERQ